VAGVSVTFRGTLCSDASGERRDGGEGEETRVPLGLTMEEIQLMIAEAAETTPDIGPDGNEMSDPEYVTAYLLNIIIPLLRYNNMRIEEQLRAIGIVIPDTLPSADAPNS
jgi:hypothetical protein